MILCVMCQRYYGVLCNRALLLEGGAAYRMGGKSPVGAYKRVEAVQFFSCFQNNSYRII